MFSIRNKAVVAASILGLGFVGSSLAASLDGPSVYAQRCAACHDNASDRTPPRARLGSMTPEQIVGALTGGTMQLQAAGLNSDEVRNVAEFLSGKKLGQTAPVATAKACPRAAPPLSMKADAWNGWGVDLANTRYQTKPELKAADVPKLKVKWAYALEGPQAVGQPTVIGDRIFVSHATGRIDALDANSGCEYWHFAADSSVRTPITIGELKGAPKPRHVAFFGSFKAIAYALDAQTGEEIWRTKVDEHVVARLTGAPAFYDGVVYFPLSSHEETVGSNEKYSCCTFRGAVVAIDAASGKIIWKGYGIPVEPKPIKMSSAGTQLYGPAGGAIWSAPTIDVKRKLIYAATGNSYTAVDTQGGNDSIVAFDLKTGKRVWANQVTPKDAFILGCPKNKEGTGNCPDEGGPDFDFGSSPILQTMSNGKQIIIAGQKSGIVYGLDPDKKGALVWQTRLGAGSPIGGVEWGFSADSKFAYVPISDVFAREGAAPGLYAVQLETGKIAWQVPTPQPVCSWTSGRCTRAQSAASSVIPGVVFSGAFDGHLRAYSTNDGAVVWDYDTGPAMDTVNGLRVEGGSIDATGPVIVNGTVYISSGYGAWGKAGRLLLAFSVDGK